MTDSSTTSRNTGNALGNKEKRKHRRRRKFLFISLSKCIQKDRVHTRRFERRKNTELSSKKSSGLWSWSCYAIRFFFSQIPPCFFVSSCFNFILKIDGELMNTFFFQSVIFRSPQCIQYQLLHIDYTFAAFCDKSHKMLESGSKHPITLMQM